MNSKNRSTIWTVGHSTHTAEKFEKILTSHNIEVLVDVRTFPGSRRYPQFNREALANTLAAIGIRYQHEPRLGGRRAPRSDSHNTGWTNMQFRGYADHMETEEFKQGVRELLEVAKDARVAVMCAEAVWWRCHRSLLSDYLKIAGHEVIHILNPSKTEEHPYTSPAIVIGGKLSYRGLF